MGFVSILFEGDQEGVHLSDQAPVFFRDLNLDQLVATLTVGFEEYNLAPFYFAPLKSLGTILYRQSVMADLESPAVREAIRLFSDQMRSVRTLLDRAGRMAHKYASQRTFLIAADAYRSALERLRLDVFALRLRSQGWLAFSNYIGGYLASTAFASFAGQIDSLKRELSLIRYCLLLKGDSVTVQSVESESDYSLSVEETFAKFRQDQGQRFPLSIREIESDNHIQAQVMDGVAELYPGVFEALAAFCSEHGAFVDLVISRFDREVQFYIAYLVYMEKLRQTGLYFCQPHLQTVSREVAAREAFDIVLAGKLIREKSPVVCNEFSLSGDERILVVSGPNHGGKTTFARMFGQMHYLACLGLPVPGTEAQLLIFDQLFTHFEMEEDITTLRGKLQDDLVRVHAILSKATANSIVIINEIFSSTTLQDALFLGRTIFRRISTLDLLCVCVTFLDELSTFNEKAVSIVSIANPANPAQRTYRLERQPADGLAYALAIAEKHNVTYRQLIARIRNPIERRH